MGIDRNGLAKERRRLIILSLATKERAEIIERFCRLRIAGNGCPKLPLGFLESLSLHQGGTQLIVSLREMGIQFEGLAQLMLFTTRISQFCKGECQVVMQSGILRLQKKGFLVRFDGLAREPLLEQFIAVAIQSGRLRFLLGLLFQVLENFELLFGRSLVLFVVENQSELISRLGTIRLQLDGCPQLAYGVIYSPQAAENRAQMAMRFVTRRV